MILTVDLETYSPQDIGKVGAYRYAQDPDFEILLCSLAVDDGKVRIYDPAYAESWFELKISRTYSSTPATPSGPGTPPLNGGA